MNMRQSHTAVVERNQCWEGEFATERYEVGWSPEAIFLCEYSALNRRIRTIRFRSI